LLRRRVSESVTDLVSRLLEIEHGQQ
jgi:hypothetical protein